MNKHTPRIEELLQQSHPHDRPRPEWKLALIETMNTSLKKSSRFAKWKWQLTFVGAIGFLAVGALTTVLTRSIIEQAHQTTAYPIYVADEWTREHVRYSVAPNFQWPQVFSNYMLQYQETTRTQADAIAKNMNADFLDFPVQEHDGRITYKTDDAYMEFREGGVFEYQLFTPETYLDYTKQQHATYAEQESMVRAFIDAHAELLIGENYVFDSRQDNEVVRVIVDEQYSYQALTVEFYDGQLFRVSGVLVSAVTKEDTIDYGTVDEIVDYLNFNPSFPIHGEKVDVDIHYVITGYRITEDGVQLKYELQNPGAVEKALRIEWMFEEGAGEEKNQIVEGYTVLPLPAERVVDMRQVEQYRNSQ